MKLCENCGNEHNGSIGSGRFCSLTCSRSFSTKHKRTEINQKVSDKLKGKGNDCITKKCLYCGNEFKVSWIKRDQKTCSISCGAKERWKDIEYKKKISESSRISAIKKHANPNVKFGWRKRTKFEMSYPEKIANSILENSGVKYEYEYPMHPYFIDFALIDYRIAIEIDGQQHLLPERIEKDIKKDALLNNNGWKVYRIKYPSQNIKESIVEILKTIIPNF